MRPVRFRLEAVFDIEAAFAWYERRSPRLGLRFLTAVAATLDAIEARPEAFPCVVGDTRRALVRPRFPYGLFFRILDEEIEIVACFHVRRDPSSWSTR